MGARIPCRIIGADVGAAEAETRVQDQDRFRGAASAAASGDGAYEVGITSARE